MQKKNIIQKLDCHSSFYVLVQMMLKPITQLTKNLAAG